MKIIAYHIRHRFFISKSDVRQSATFDPAQSKSADFPDRDFGGVTFPISGRGVMPLARTYHYEIFHQFSPRVIS
jgi:hypothetical protein